MKFCQRHDLIDRQSYVAQYISLAILSIGLTTLLGSDDLLAAFSCGVAFAWDGFFNRQTEEAVFSSVIDTLFNIAAFIFVGAWMPFDKFEDKLLTLEVWRLVVIAILVLILRRLPIMIALYKWIPDIKTFREAIFSGHFGPIGIGAIFISTLAIEVLREATAEGPQTETGQLGKTELLMQTIQPIVAFMVLCSITIHGLSIPSFSLGMRVHSVSRTWSRRDTMNSTGARTPEWANQARLVTRREDIVINRDPTQLPPDLENGHVEKDTTSEETKVFSSSSTRQSTQETGNTRGADSPTGQRHIEMSTVTRTNTSDTQASWGSPSQGQSSGPSLIVRDYKAEDPPDGTEILSDWREGKYHVTERRSGSGEDVSLFQHKFDFTLNDFPKVEVMVTNEDPSASDTIFPHRKWSGKLYELEKKAEEVGMGIRDMMKEIGTLREKDLNPFGQGNMDSSRGLGHGEHTHSTRDEDEDGWASDTSDIPDEKGTGSSNPGMRGAKHRSGWSYNPHHGHHKSRKRSIRRGHMADGATKIEGQEVGEELRGRNNRPSSGSGTTSVTFAGGTNLPKSRPGTADTYPSRTSAGDSSLRNHRVESLRTLHSIPPTRENSPSRSVRFDVSTNNPRKNSAGDFPGGDANASTPISSPLASAQTSRAPSPTPGYHKQP